MIRQIGNKTLEHGRRGDWRRRRRCRQDWGHRLTEKVETVDAQLPAPNEGEASGFDESNTHLDSDWSGCGLPDSVDCGAVGVLVRWRVEIGDYRRGGCWLLAAAVLLGLAARKGSIRFCVFGIWKTGSGTALGS
ncbi:hypothetical protein Ancab_002380 [Ancistrocladus abbreviatus]